MSGWNRYGILLVVFLSSLVVFGQEKPQTQMIKITSKKIDYGEKEKLEGLLLLSDTIKKPAPAILLVHNWMGITNETIHQASRFAGLGYVVFAADIYGKEIRPKDTKEAAKLANKYKSDRKLFRERLNLALEELKKNENVDSTKIAVVGYCFGGTGAIELARSGANILGAVSFHGGLDSPKPEDGKNIKCKILALCGAIDPAVSPEDIVAFEAELNQAKVDYQIIRYSNTVHSFTEQSAGSDSSKGAAYNANSDKRSLLATEIFLTEIFNNVKY